MKVRLCRGREVSVSSWNTHAFLIRSVGYYGPAGSGGGFLELHLQDDLLLLLLEDLSVLEPTAHVERILERGSQ